MACVLKDIKKQLIIFFIEKCQMLESELPQHILLTVSRWNQNMDSTFISSQESLALTQFLKQGCHVTQSCCFKVICVFNFQISHFILDGTLELLSIIP